jgi:filamentous hemagglutinin
LLDAVTDVRLANIVRDLFREGAAVGDGGTADAIRYERRTGQLLSLRGHTEKGRNYVVALRRLLAQGDLMLEDSAIAESLLNDLQKALDGE